MNNNNAPGSGFASTPQEAEQIARDIYSGLTGGQLGLTHAQAVGVIANLAHETGNFRHSQEIAPTVQGSRGGFGWAQWTGSRRNDFEEFATAKGLEPTSFAANLEFLTHEMLTKEKAALNALKSTSSIKDATRTFENSFERAGIVNMASRNRFADKYSNLTAAPKSPIDPAQFSYAQSTLGTPTPADRSVAGSKAVQLASVLGPASIVSADVDPIGNAMGVMQSGTLDPATSFSPTSAEIGGLLSPSSEMSAPGLLAGLDPSSVTSTNPYGVDDFARSTGQIGTPSRNPGAVDPSAVAQAMASAGPSIEAPQTGLDMQGATVMGFPSYTAGPVAEIASAQPEPSISGGILSGPSANAQGQGAVDFQPAQQAPQDNSQEMASLGRTWGQDYAEPSISPQAAPAGGLSDADYARAAQGVHSNFDAETGLFTGPTQQAAPQEQSNAITAADYASSIAAAPDMAAPSYSPAAEAAMDPGMGILDGVETPTAGILGASAVSGVTPGNVGSLDEATSLDSRNIGLGTASASSAASALGKSGVLGTSPNEDVLAVEKDLTAVPEKPAVTAPAIAKAQTSVDVPNTISPEAVGVPDEAATKSNAIGTAKGAILGGLVAGVPGAVLGGILGSRTDIGGVLGNIGQIGGGMLGGITGILGGKGPSAGFATAGQPGGQYGGYGDGGGYGAQSYGYGGDSRGMGGYEQFGGGFVGPGSGGWADAGQGFGQGSAADIGT